jgi:hypothetical protein
VDGFGVLVFLFRSNLEEVGRVETATSIILRIWTAILRPIQIVLRPIILEILVLQPVLRIVQPALRILHWIIIAVKRRPPKTPCVRMRYVPVLCANVRRIVVVRYKIVILVEAVDISFVVRVLGKLFRGLGLSEKHYYK